MSDTVEPTGTVHEVDMTTANRLQSFVERVERLEEEKAGIGGDIKDVFAEMKGEGFDTKAVKMIIRRRKKSRDELMEEEAILTTYETALGMV